MKYNPFLRWWLFCSLILTVFAVLWWVGLVGELYEKDASKLSFLILGIFVVSSIRCGINTWKVCKYRGPHQVQTILCSEENFRKSVKIDWFCSDVVFTLGLLGTIVGMISMLSSFSTVAVGDVASMKKLVSSIGSGMSTALLTTGVGALAGLLLKVECFNLERELYAE